MTANTKMVLFKVIPMAGIHMAFPVEFHFHTEMTDDLPGDAMGEAMVEGMRLARQHTNWNVIDVPDKRVFYIVQIEPLSSDTRKDYPL